MTKILVLYYSTYGHLEIMANAVAEGAKGVAGVSVDVKRVPELVPAEVAKASHFKLDQKAPVATVDELANYDAIIFGAPTRFGVAASQMRNFLDQTGGLWAKGALIGKVGSVFTSTATQHGGQESTILSLHTTLLQSRHGHRRPALFLRRADDAEGDHRRLALRRQHHRRRRRQPDAERERTRHGPFPGRPRGQDREQAEGLASKQSPSVAKGGRRAALSVSRA